eukprot:5482433-Prymnesium_polylepis.1
MYEVLKLDDFLLEARFLIHRAHSIPAHLLTPLCLRPTLDSRCWAHLLSTVVWLRRCGRAASRRREIGRARGDLASYDCTRPAFWSTWRSKATRCRGTCLRSLTRP